MSLSAMYIQERFLRGRTEWGDVIHDENEELKEEESDIFLSSEDEQEMEDKNTQARNQNREKEKPRMDPADSVAMDLQRFLNLSKILRNFIANPPLSLMNSHS